MADLLVKIKYRNDTAANWTAINPILDLAEPGIENDTGKFKVGDGVTPWSELAYSVGADGPMGPAGNDGAQGPAGIQGDTGLTGPAGSDGSDGAQGIQGDAGPQGIPGNDGAQGIQGDAGPQGVPGNDGSDGAQGPPGDDGADGAQGIQGIQGVPGSDGSDGAQGVQGDPGPQGPQGDTGPEGPEGPQGPQGPAGGSGTATRIYESAAVNGTDIHNGDKNSVDVPFIAAGDGVWLDKSGADFTALQDIPVLELICTVGIDSAVNNRSIYRMDINHRDASDVDIYTYKGQSVYLRDDNAAYNAGSFQMTLPIRGILNGHKITVRMYTMDTQTAASSSAPVDTNESQLLMTVVA